MLISIGIDYSMTSPAICVHTGNEWSFDNCKFYYFIRKKKQEVISDQFIHTYYPEYQHDLERYDLLSDWSLDIIQRYKEVKKVHIEGFSYGSSGSRIFNMSENVGLLKHKLWKSGCEIQTPAPSEIKKFASGKGNCNKEVMYDSFLSETSVDLRKELFLEKGWNPLSDIVDAYYIAKLGFTRDTTL